MGKTLSEERKDKMLKARYEKESNRARFKIDHIEILSYEYGWILRIGNEDDRFYSTLCALFKKLYSIKLSRTAMRSITEAGACAERIYQQVSDIGKQLDKLIREK